MGGRRTSRRGGTARSSRWSAYSPPSSPSAARAARWGSPAASSPTWRGRCGPPSSACAAPRAPPRRRLPRVPSHAGPPRRATAAASPLRHARRPPLQRVGGARSSPACRRAALAHRAAHDDQPARDVRRRPRRLARARRLVVAFVVSGSFLLMNLALPLIYQSYCASHLKQDEKERRSARGPREGLLRPPPPRPHRAPRGDRRPAAGSTPGSHGSASPLSSRRSRRSSSPAAAPHRRSPRRLRTAGRSPTRRRRRPASWCLPTA